MIGIALAYAVGLAFHGLRFGNYLRRYLRNLAWFRGRA